MKKALIILFIVFETIATAQYQYTKLFDFSNSTGQSPAGDMFYDGTFLYGMTGSGGANSKGNIFKILPNGSGYVDMLDFAGSSNGSMPNGSLIFDGTFFYGMTVEGGTSTNCGTTGCGTIFKIKPDGSGYVKLYDFAGNVANGIEPNGSLVYDGTFLYGMTYSGGANGDGVIFKIKPDGSSFSKLLDFAGSSNGSYPYSHLFLDSTFLYGMTPSGGANADGVLFKIMTNGSGYVKLLDFAGTVNGKWPYGSLISDGVFLYGMTIEGGTNNKGVIFKIMPDGSGYTKIMDFTDGNQPHGTLIYDGTFLYGMTQQGGSINTCPGSCGIIFKLKTDGSGYTKLMDFANITGNQPIGSLITDGACLYGMTTNGGANTYGTVFKLALSVGVEQLANINEQIIIYPNPTAGIFNIKSDNLDKQVVDVYDVNGRQVLNTILIGTTTDIDASSLDNGIYTMTIKNNLTIVYKKMVIAR